MGDRKREDGYVTDLITEKAIGWLDSIKDGDEPFSILIHHKAPHRTWMPAVRHLDSFRGKELPEPETLFDDYSTRETTAGAQEMSIATHLRDNYDLFLGIGMNEPGDWGNRYLNSQASLMTEEERSAWEESYRQDNQEFLDNTPTGDDRIRWNYQRYMRNYLGVVDGLDENIGRVLDYLKENDLEENTIVIYTSDQGFYLGDHGWYDKRWMYEESFRMPLVIRYPKMIEAGTQSSDLVQNLDFAPTLLDLAGVEVPADMQGISMRSILDQSNDEGNGRNSLYYHYYEYPGVHAVKRHYGVMHENFKLMHYYHDVDTWEMFDLSSDPNELTNVYDNPEYESIREDLHKKLKELQVQYGDTLESMRTPPSIDEISHSAVGAEVEYILGPSPRYNKGESTNLTDGKKWSYHPYFSNYRSNYLGFEGDGAEFIIDLKESKPVSEVLVHALQEPSVWIHYPEQIQVSFSQDGELFGAEVQLALSKTREAGDNFFSISTSSPARYIKLKVKNLQTIPENMPGSGQQAWLFIDEVVVN